MRDYDRIFNEDVDKEFFYNKPGYTGTKLVVGKISLENALHRLNKNEYYTLVTYDEGMELPSEYVPIDEEIRGDLLLATFDPKLQMQNVCQNGGIQMASKLRDDEYLLGPGPDTFVVSKAVKEQVEEYKQMDEEMSTGRSR